MSRFGYGSLNPPLRPRRGNTLYVLGVARISGDTQDEKSLADQEALYRSWLDQNTDCPYELTMIATRAKGELVERAELLELDEAINSRRFDLVIAEDLGRVIRRVHAILICEACEDAETRLIALNDSVDTAREDWRLHSYFASMRHEQYNQDTSRRIRRTLRNRFMQGGVLRILPFCYRRLPGGKIDTEIEKIPELIPIVEEIIRRLEAGQYYSEVADWLNEQNVRVGPGSRSNRWTHQLVRYFIMNPILKGIRVFNHKVSKRKNKSGRRVPVKAPPEERLEREVPHLAFLSRDRYDRLIAMLAARNEKYTVAKRGQHDPRKGRPKKRTRWPGQQVECSICGNKLVFGAHGQKTHMMCNGASRYECWNGITFDAELCVPRMAKAVFDCIAELPEFDATLNALLLEESEALNSSRRSRRVEVEREIAITKRELANVTKAICAVGHSDALLEELNGLEKRLRDLTCELADMDDKPASEILLPPVTVIRRQALECFQELALDSFEFAREIRNVVPRIVAIPVRIADGGDIALRAKMTVSLASLVPSTYQTPSVLAHLQREIVVDLFEMPQRAAFRQQVVELRKTLTERQAAKELGLTVTAAQRAAALQRIMDKLGITDPYITLMEPPSELRRHLHPRYRFNPLPPPEAA